MTLIAAGPSGTGGALLATFDEPQAGRLGELMSELIHAVRADAVLAKVQPHILEAVAPIRGRFQR